MCVFCTHFLLSNSRKEGLLVRNLEIVEAMCVACEKDTFVDVQF